VRAARGVIRESDRLVIRTIETDKREAARRYAIKTRLQSLLVQRVSDEMQVVPDDKEGVVLLRHSEG
jgi:hypothetical protein